MAGCSNLNGDGLVPADQVTAQMLKSGARISWHAPTSYADGSSLLATDIKSYNLYYGNVSGGPYPNIASVSGTENVISMYMLNKGSWYFVVSCVTKNGQESVYSNEVSKVIK